ncbi:MAG: hypothetical protein V4753_05040 [Pseudomonadota bacterium]
MQSPREPEWFTYLNDKLARFLPEIRFASQIPFLVPSLAMIAGLDVCIPNEDGSGADQIEAVELNDISLERDPK